MRIGMMCHSSMGGSAHIAIELANALAYRGHRVHLFTRATPFHPVRHSNLVLHTIGTDGVPGGYPGKLETDWPISDQQDYLSLVLRVIEKERLDLLHFHYALPFALLAATMKQRLREVAPRLVGTLHGTDVSIFGRQTITRRRLSEAFEYLDALTTVSSDHARLVTQLLDLPRPPIVIPNFIDLRRFSPSPRNHSPPNLERDKSAPPRPRIIHISNFRKVKAPESVAHIFGLIRKRMEAELWLVGDGDEMESVKAILRQNEVDGDTRYWGARLDVAPLLAQADLFLLTSLAESFSVAALEAMACGVPVVATRVGGVPEVVIHEKTGFLYPVGDHETAARLAIDVLSHPEQHQSLREAAIAHARRFGVETIVPLYEALYRHLCNRPASRERSTVTVATRND